MESLNLSTVLTVVRITASIVLIVFLIFGLKVILTNSRTTRKQNELLGTLLEHAQLDRQERAQAVITVQKEAAALAKQTAEAIRRSEEYLSEIRELTVASALESRNAITAANSTNDKIADLNQRTNDTIRAVAEASNAKNTVAAASLHTHIEEGVSVGKGVDEKVDKLVEKSIDIHVKVKDDKK